MPIGGDAGCAGGGEVGRRRNVRDCMAVRGAGKMVHFGYKTADNRAAAGRGAVCCADRMRQKRAGARTKRNRPGGGRNGNLITSGDDLRLFLAEGVTDTCRPGVHPDL